MDIMQTVLTICAVTVTVMIVMLVARALETLKQLEVSLTKFDKISDDIDSISSSLRQPVASFSEFMMGFKNGAMLLNNLAPQIKRFISRKVK